MKIQLFRSVRRSNVIMVMEQNGEESPPTDGIEDIDTRQTQDNVEIRDIINRLSKLEEDNIELFKKLNDVNDLNITKLPKDEEDNNKVFKKLDDITKAIDRLNMKILRIYDERYVTQVYANRRKRNSN